MHTMLQVIKLAPTPSSRCPEVPTLRACSILRSPAWVDTRRRTAMYPVLEGNSGPFRRSTAEDGCKVPRWLSTAAAVRRRRLKRSFATSRPHRRWSLRGRCHRRRRERSATQQGWGRLRAVRQGRLAMSRRLDLHCQRPAARRPRTRRSLVLPVTDAR